MKDKLIAGKHLNKEQLQQVKSVYVNRFLAIGEGEYYKTEQDWILDHAFYIKKDGSLSNRHKHCEPVYMADN